MSNLALNKNAYASGSMAPFLPSRAVTGTWEPTSRWLCTTTPSWLAVDLGTTYWVDHMVVKMMGMAGWNPQQNYNMCDFKFQGSKDNVTWVDLDTVTNNSNNQYEKYFMPSRVRYVRVYVTKGLRVNNKVASVMELEAYENANAPYLGNLEIGQWTLSPAFSEHTFDYTTSVGADVHTINVTPTSVHSNSIIKVNNTPVSSGQTTPVSIVNTKVITIEVSSPDNSMKETYTINVLQATKSSFLSNLVVNGLRGAMTPTFSKEIDSYSGNVAGGVSSVTVTPTAEDSQANIKVNNAVVASGGTSAPISLAIGSNTITVLVTAADNSSQKTYTVTVNRPS